MSTRVVVIGMLLAAAACAQTMTSATGSGSGAGFSGSATFSPQRFAMPPVSGAAYSGEESNDQVQTLSDGTHITHKMMGRKVWRDSQGRTRSERPLFWNPNQPNPSPFTVVEITDPVGGFQYVLDTQAKVAHRSALATPPARGGMRAGAMTQASIGVTGGMIGSAIGPPTGPVNNNLRPEFRTEQLGTKLIEGVMAEGQRNSVTYPTGMMGNDQPFTVVTETWMSPDLKMPILTVTHDPRSGDRTFRIANLSRTEPDPTLFMAPADYTIVDEKDAFTIQYKGQ